MVWRREKECKARGEALGGSQVQRGKQTKKIIKKKREEERD